MQLAPDRGENLRRRLLGVGQRLETDESRPGEARVREQSELPTRGADVDHRGKLGAERDRGVLERREDPLPQPLVGRQPQARSPQQRQDLGGPNSSEREIHACPPAPRRTVPTGPPSVSRRKSPSALRSPSNASGGMSSRATQR